MQKRMRKKYLYQRVYSIFKRANSIYAALIFYFFFFVQDRGSGFLVDTKLSDGQIKRADSVAGETRSIRTFL
jgi:hypothetical protein